MVGRHGSGSSYVYRKGPTPSPVGEKTEDGSPSKTTLPADRLKEIQAAVEASPNKIAVIFARDHQVPGKSMHASDKFKFDDGSRSWDHVAIAWMDANGNLVFAEARPVNGAWGVVFFGKNDPGTATQLVTEYKDFKVLSIDLGRYGPGARDAFVNAVSAATGPGSNYSATNRNIGTVCSAAIEKGFAAARDAQKPLPPWVKNLKASFERVTLLGLNQLNLYTPKRAYLEVAKHSVPFRFNPAAPVAKREWLVVGQPKIVVVETDISNSVNDAGNAALAGLALGTIVTLPPEARASQQPRPDDDQKPLQQELKDPSDEEDDEDALADDSLQDPETDADDDEEDLEEEASLAPDSQDARTGNAPQQPAIDDDADDDDDTDDSAQQPAIDDDDEEPAQEDDEEDELADASDAEDAPTADAPVMQTANAEGGADATGDDQPGPQLATSAPVTAEDGFSFSLFPKPAVPTEVAKEAMPADQAPPEESSSSGAPGSEGAHPDLESADVGNAAPSKEPVVHHGDLAP
ncbi:MAG: hypothetical protein ACJ8FA_08165 [Xanthobacteraceae bacterium]